MAELRALLEELRCGAAPSLDVDQVDALVGWLLGKSESEALPQPEHDPVLRQLVFHHLDAVLFSGGRLQLQSAGLGPGEPDDLRRTRFRRLAAAFHPDRHPGLADWLTERSQTVLQAYSRFKLGDEPQPAVITPSAGPYPGDPPPRPPRRGPFRAWRTRWAAGMVQLRGRFGNDRWLPHKLIGGLALVALLPVLNLVLVPTPEPVGRTMDRTNGDARSFPHSAAGSVANNTAPSSDPGSPTSADAAAGEARAIPDSALACDDRRSTLDADVPLDGQAADAESDPAPESALLAAARHAMRLDDHRGGPLPTVDEQLAAMGLDSDTERLYRRIRSEGRTRPRAASADARAAESPSREPVAAAQPGAATAVATLEPVEPVERTEPKTSDRAEASRQTGMATVALARTPPVPAAEATVDERKAPAALASAATTAPPQQATDRQANIETETAAELAARAAPAPAPSPPALADSTLKLGLVSGQPAGDVLRGYVADLESGNLISLLNRFDPRARQGDARGTDAIARYYRTLFDRHEPRRIELRVVRIERQKLGMRIETELRIEGMRDHRIEVAHKGRAVFVLDGDPLRIERLEW